MTANNLTPATGRAVVVSTVFQETEAARRLGLEAYSYPFAARAFLPLLRDWGETVLVDRPESRVDHALRQLVRKGLNPLHLSFLPLHATWLTPQAPNVCFPFWEYADLPDQPLGHNPRANWANVAGHAALILTASTFTRQVFERTGVRTPVHVVPVPVCPAYFAVSDWEPRQRYRLDCPCYVFPPVSTGAPLAADPWLPEEQHPSRFFEKLGGVYRGHLRRLLPRRLDQCLTATARLVQAWRAEYRKEAVVAHPVTPHLDLSGVVYTTVLSPFDARKNLHDLLTGFLLALGEQEDATLVVKLVINPERKVPALNLVLSEVRRLGLAHRCKLVFVADYLSDEQMVELARASTYYVTATRAEGACLPLRDFLAAGRPGIAPTHTALSDYFGPDVGFTIVSHPEPTCWPIDPSRRLTTTWHRIVWQSLFDKLRTSYDVARRQPGRYLRMAESARWSMHRHASEECVRPLLSAALDGLRAGLLDVPQRTPADESRTAA